jgi:GNAT superfamily N-acetyltransferase
MFAYKIVDKEEIDHLLEDCLSSWNCIYDNYYEDCILNSVFYEMRYDKKEIGYFSVFSETIISQFYIKEEFRHLTQGCFKRILGDLNITDAYVPTCDVLFLSISMDFQRSIKIKSYFFKETDRTVKGANFPKSMLRLASLSDAELIKKLSKDFFEDLYQKISDREIYILEDEVVYGFGILSHHKINKDYKSIGMYTVDAHRHQGVGRSIVLHLKDLVHTMGGETLLGCFYQDYNSKRTLESCGYVSDVRLLNVLFES